ncbi:MAG: phenylalanine--tRNA ligase subunit alpha [Candidatus Micrarchaeota archaeon]
MNELEQRALRAMEKHHDYVPAKRLSENEKIEYATLMSILNKLSGERLIDLKKSESTFAEITPEGLAYAERGLPERKLAEHLRKTPIEFNSIAGIVKISPAEAQIAVQWGRRNGWINIMKEVGRTVVSLAHPNAAEAQTPEEKLLLKLENGRVQFEGSPEFLNLKSRNLISLASEKEFEAKITSDGRKAASAPVTDKISQLSPALIKEGKWKDLQFREYDLQTMLQPSVNASGKKHFYLQFVRELKEQLASLGFKEAEGPFTELEFWNMDALFMPQDHPARDIHDVFQLEVPEGKLPDEKIVSGVKKAHEKGIGGSRGWGYAWNAKMASKIVLRSQTTTVSARTLASGIKPPFKMFCIGKVFRPDDIDWKHFLEFNQCEGIVADENMNFRELLGYLKTFAVDIFGAKPADVQFAPSYFPFTEPSVEMMVKINGKWTEVGGAGIFRPEMTLPLQCNLPVLAWGLGLDRLAMIKLGLKDIRDLFSQDLQFLREK